MSKVSIWLACAALCCSTPLIAKSAQADLKEAVSERIARHQGEVAASKAAFDKAVSEFKLADEGKDPSAKDKALAVLKAADAFGYAVARTDTVGALANFLATKPSPTKLSFWMQDQIDRLQIANAKLKADNEALIAKPDKAVQDFAGIMFSAGAIAGTTDELILIDQNLSSYTEAKSEQDAHRRAKWAAILGGIGRGLQNINPAPGIGPSVTCRDWPGGIRCTGD